MLKLRWVRWLVMGWLSAMGVLAALAAGAWWYLHPAVTRTNDLEYGRRGEQRLAFDVLRPERTNGLGVLLLVSGSWKSGSSGSFREWIAAPLLRRGYTVFPIYHVSQPKASVQEIASDMHRAVRHIRRHAGEWGIDAGRLGVTGGSAGGHLSLLLATQAAVGPKHSEGAEDRESSAVQAVAIFYPVTDLLNLGRSTENLGDGGPPKSFRKAFGPGATNLPVWREVGRELSPIYHVTSNLPPTLIYHGDADTLVPLDQSQRFCERARELGRPIELIVHPGGGHGWWSMVFDIIRFADWFDAHLLKAQP